MSRIVIAADVSTAFRAEPLNRVYQLFFELLPKLLVTPVSLEIQRLPASETEGAVIKAPWSWDGQISHHHVDYPFQRRLMQHELQSPVAGFTRADRAVIDEEWPTIRQSSKGILGAVQDWVLAAQESGKERVSVACYVWGDTWVRLSPEEAQVTTRVLREKDPSSELLEPFLMSMCYMVWRASQFLASLHVSSSSPVFSEPTASSTEPTNLSPRLDPDGSFLQIAGFLRSVRDDMHLSPEAFSLEVEGNASPRYIQMFSDIIRQ